MSLESDGGMILTGENRRTRRKTSTTLSTTNPTWIDPCANPGLRGERPSTNDLSYDTAQSELLVSGAYFSVSHASRQKPYSDETLLWVLNTDTAAWLTPPQICRS
jgi:hypothetical protein